MSDLIRFIGELNMARLIQICFFVGVMGFLGYLPGQPTVLRVLNLFFIIPGIVSLIRRFADPAEPDQGEVPPVNAPLPPAAGGKFRFWLRVYLATGMMLVVPSMLRQIIRQDRGQSQAMPRAIDDISQYQQKTRYHLPFDGEWLVINGGVSPKTSHSWDVVAQRYAYDFFVVDEHMRRWKTNGKHVTDYLCYDLPVLAPADGVVTAVHDGVRDAPSVGKGWLDIFTPHFPGNTVTIRHAEGEYSFLAHLKPGSILVNVGDEVRQGQTIARCGHSGNSTEPHLHFQVQDHPDFFDAAGLPVAFDQVSVNGSPPQDCVYLVRGMKISRADS